MPLGVYLAMWVAMFIVMSLPVKNNTSTCLLQRWMAEKNVPSQNDTMTEKLTSCDTQKNKKTNITKQLNGTKHNVLPPPNKSWLGCGPCRITVSHYQAAARQLTEYNRAKESLWSPYGKTWTVKQDTRGLWNHQLSQYRQRTLMARWLPRDCKMLYVKHGVYKSNMAYFELNMMKILHAHTEKPMNCKPHPCDGYGLFHPAVADTQDHPGVN